MAPVHGSKAAFKLDNAAGSLQTLTTYLSSITAPAFDIDTVESSTMGQVAKTHVTGLYGASISGEGPWDPTLDAHLAALVGLATTSSFEYGPQGASTGNVKYSGEAWLTSYDPDSSVDGLSGISFELIVTGAVTRGTFS